MVQQDLQSRLQRIKEIESGMPQKVPFSGPEVPLGVDFCHFGVCHTCIAIY